MKIGIVDYNAGNIKSVERSLSYLGIDYVLSKKPAELEKCGKLLFPGVGDAKYAMEQLKLTGFDSFLRDWHAACKPLLGICLGSQIIFDHSEEGDVDCLGLVKGNIAHFSSLLSMEVLKNERIKVPHMGYNDIEIESRIKSTSDPIFNGISPNASFYFIHSYVIQPSDKSVVLAHCNYGIEVPSVIKSKNLYAFQFHPEKSGKEGLKLLENFCTLESPSCGHEDTADFEYSESGVPKC